MKEAVIAVLLGGVYAGAIYGATELDLAGRSRGVQRLALLAFLVWGVGGAFLIAAVATKPAYALIGVAAVAAVAAIRAAQANGRSG
jgi:hypothetical protein